VIILVSVGVVFANEFASSINGLTGWRNESLIFAIFAFFLAATIRPIDKFIGRTFPTSSIIIMLMGLGIVIKLLSMDASLPEFNPDITTKNLHFDSEHQPPIPALFHTIACDATSGYHSTKAHVIARCLTNKKLGLSNQPLN
jgi:carbon starvation protein CstA